uniref:Putative YopX protein n=1 Tax=viral metagenome TaxID=1070528 RepID=A0A6M3KUR9_9ZZZZ
MREIKFRGLYETTNGERHWDFYGISSKPGLIGATWIIEDLQYTGLKDKNGKEVYFDDVVKFRNSTFKIVWDDECACVMLKRLSGTDGMTEIPAHNIKQSEVIGNVYEEEVK